MKYHTANLDAGYVWAIVQEQVETHTAQFPDRVGAIDADDVGGGGDGGGNGGVGDDDGDGDGGAIYYRLVLTQMLECGLSPISGSDSSGRY